MLERTEPEFLPLTAVRVLFAVDIWLVHFVFDPMGPRGIPDDWLELAVCTVAIAALPFFFTLSGYLLGRHYLSRLDRHPSVLPRYFSQRFWRMAPLYYLGFATMVGIYLVQGLVGSERPGIGLAAWREMALSVVGMQAWFFEGGTLLFNFPAWSLSVEVALYLMFPWLGRALVEHPACRYLVIAMTALATIAMTALAVHYPGPERASDLGRSPLMHVPAFLVGILMAMAAKRRLPTPGERVGLTCAAVSMLAAVIVACRLGVLDIERAWYLLLSTGLLSASACLIAAGSFRVGPTTWLAKTFRRSGDPSYPIYILQLPAGAIVAFAAARAGHPLVPLSAAHAILSGALLLVAALAWSTWIEPSIERRRSAPPRGARAGPPIMPP